MLMTVICILAVDFPAFPRSFGKTESWGTSLVSLITAILKTSKHINVLCGQMDLGVGSFVFSLGLTSAPALLKRIGTLQQPSSILSAIRRTWIILALGLIRLAMVKSAEYPVSTGILCPGNILNADSWSSQEHVTEYGVHWNFFFTLALLPIFGAIGERWSSRIGFKYMALLVTVLHQLCLVATPMQDYTLNDDRPNLLAQNKEGLVSFTGKAFHEDGKMTHTKHSIRRLPCNLPSRLRYRPVRPASRPVLYSPPRQAQCARKAQSGQTIQRLVQLCCTVVGIIRSLSSPST